MLSKFAHAGTTHRLTGSLFALFLLLIQASTAQTTYNVGPNFQMTTLAQVPWNTLAAGDVVNIYYNGSTYKEKFLISTSGAAGNPITIKGIAGPNGEKPIIDGDHAVSKGGQCYNTEAFGLITIEPALVNGNCPFGSYSPIPHDIVIDGLEVRNSHPSFTFSINGGAQQPYASFACGLYCERVQNLVVRNCNFNHCGLGLFINSKFGTHALSKNILVEKNYFTQNGVVGDGHDHNSYIEAINVVYQYNYYDALVWGAPGASLKDRSAGNIIRYNWIVASQGHAIQIPEAQGGQGIIDIDPNYRKTFIYGNVILNGKQGAARIIRYGGDQGIYANYRQGTLYFYNNTVINEGDKTTGVDRRWTTNLFLLPDEGEVGKVTIKEKIDCRNNIIYNQAATPGYVPTTLQLLSTNLSGTLTMTNNWVSPNTLDTASYYQSYNQGTVVTHTNTMYGNNGQNNPAFNDYPNKDYRLLPNSNAINQGAALPSAATPYPVLEEYIKHFASQARTVVGPIDLGAYENAAIAPIPATGIAVTPSVLTLTVGQKATIAASVQPANASNKTYIWASSDANIATIAPNGQVTGVAVGSAIMTATSNDGGFTATCQVTVSQPVVVPTIVGWDFKAKTQTASSGIPANLSQQITREAGYAGVYDYSVVGVQGAGDFSCSTTNWDNGVNTKYWLINFTTTGYNNLKLSSIQRASGGGPAYFVVQYRIGNAGVWTNLTSVVDSTDWVKGTISNMSLPMVCDNQNLVQLRWMVVSNTSVLNTPVTSTYSNRIDEITVVGDVMPVGGTPFKGNTGINNTALTEKISVSPNPTSSLLTVDVSLEKPEILYLQLLDTNGRSVFEWYLMSETTQHHKELDLSVYTEGVYFLVVKSASQTSTTKVLKINH